MRIEIKYRHRRQTQFFTNIRYMKKLEFIKVNRSTGGLQHGYDVVIGPVADDNTMETVQLYIAGILTVDEAIERLKYNKVNNQVSFHTGSALQCLRLIGRNVYE